MVNSCQEEVPMTSRFGWRLGQGVAALTLFVAGAWLLSVGNTERPEWSVASRAAARRPSGFPQLVSVEPLPVLDGEMCEFVPASATSGFLAATQQPPAQAAASAVRTAVNADRAPIR